jgi:hypothetical protein
MGEMTLARNTTLIWASYESREEADRAARRLERSGFARNSIDLDPRDNGGWNVGVHTSERNLERVQDILHSSDRMFALRRYGAGAAETLAANPAIVLGGLAAIGVAAYLLMPKHRRPSVHSIRELPTRVSRAAAGVPDAVRETAKAVQERVSGIPETVSDASKVVVEAIGGAARSSREGA